MDEQNSAGPVYPPVRRSGQPGEASGTSADSHAPH